MEYIVYVAIIMGLLLLCACGLYCMREEQLEPDDRDRKKKENELRLRALSNVPTPWGWPGSMRHGTGAAANGFAVNGGQAIHRWVDGLVSEKQTTENIEYQRKREACLRALLEDRFHSSSRNSHVGHHELMPLRRRDPLMLNNRVGHAPTGRLNGTKDDTLKINGNQVSTPPSRLRSRHHEPLSGVRTPWGW